MPEESSLKSTFGLEIPPISVMTTSEIVVQNGIEFQAGFYSGTTTLYPDAYYLISGNTVFDTLVVACESIVYVESDVSIGAKKIYAVGTIDSTISFSGVRGQRWRSLTDLDGFRTKNYAYDNALRRRVKVN